MLFMEVQLKQMVPNLKQLNRLDIQCSKETTMKVKHPLGINYSRVSDAKLVLTVTKQLYIQRE